MDTYTDSARRKLQGWFQKAAAWQKDLFCAIWNGADRDEQLLDRAVKLIEQQYLGQSHRLTPKTVFPGDIDFSEGKGAPILLKSVSEVKDVAALAPRSALHFSPGLTVVYGANGCGKSSYVRLLKAAENPECAGAVIGNVFAEGNSPAQAVITLFEDGEEKAVSWSRTSKMKCPIQIYDTAVATQFVDRANEMVYEPKVLSVITQMANVYAGAAERFLALARETEGRITQPPREVHPVTVSMFSGLATLRDVKAWGEKYRWDETLEAELAAVSAGLKESEPEKAAAALTAQMEVVRRHGCALLKALAYVGDRQCGDFLEKRRRQIETKKAADELIRGSREKSLLEGFGGEEWRAMWSAAGWYMEQAEGSGALPVSREGRCALCQQRVEQEAMERLEAFKAFTESRVITASADAHRVFEEAVGALQDNIGNKLNLAAIERELVSNLLPGEIRERILGYYRGITARCRWLLTYHDDMAEELPPVGTAEEITEAFRQTVEAMEQQINALQATAADRQKQTARRDQLLTARWVAENLETKGLLIRLAAIQSKCKTNALTTLKKDLSDILITEAYITRFREEMKALDANGQIRAELVSKGARRGRAYYQVALRGARSGGRKTGEILSEGEFRVVSLAAFLADLSSWGKVMPFIFDDPITSMDQFFEERVARRLIRLSTERQVIVFTHRLAFAQKLNAGVAEYNAKAADRAAITHVELRRSPLGEPSAPSHLKEFPMKTAAGEMLKRLSRVRAAQEAGDYETADSIIQTLCSDFRKAVEQSIGADLLSGIISRFDNRILSMKLPRLSAITKEDVELLHGMMTKYSHYEHSQSAEAPVPLPGVDEVKGDLETMQAWAKEFSSRCKQAEERANGK